ncbi:MULTISPECIES: DUF6153 family protein [unclassified Streptomyces]|uniref:DUF6153 family protein n=1 Tax=unclassified Streptomyces TaxID=2593676 RepID=UPI00131C5E65|nr:MULTISPECIES: DUF6153 family protein [unclassified Streptomyces]
MISGNVRRGRPKGALLRATLLAVVLALFAMHVLASHQPVHSGHATAIPRVDAPATTAHTHSHAAPADAAAPPHGPPGPDGECDHGGVEESCLALLYIVAALFTFALRRVGTNGVLRPWAARTYSWTSRTGDPPCLHRLSILRC